MFTSHMRYRFSTSGIRYGHCGENSNPVHRISEASILAITSTLRAFEVTHEKLVKLEFHSPISIHGNQYAAPPRESMKYYSYLSATQTLGRAHGRMFAFFLKKKVGLDWLALVTSLLRTLHNCKPHHQSSADRKHMEDRVWL